MPNFVVFGWTNGFMMEPLLLAIQFLTRIPVPAPVAATQRQLGLSVLCYPLVGLMIGLLLTVIAQWLLAVPVNLAAAVVLLVWVLLTGGLHLDGLADSTDAWIGGIGDRQRSLDIMKDPAAGPAAVVALVLVLLLKWSAITALLQHQLYLPLVFAPLWGRLAIAGLMLTASYIRVGGIGEQLARQMPRHAAVALLLLGAAATYFFIGVLPLLGAVLILFMVRQLALARLGGVTGDIYGAAVELVETAVLTAAVVQGLI